MVGIIKNLFGGKENYYAELEEDQGKSSETEVKEAKEEQDAQSEPAPVSSPQPPVMAQNNGQPQMEELRGETFAPTYLIPQATTPRRRPGVNMSQFLDLAREMNTRRNQ